MTSESAAKPTVVEALSRVMDAVQAVRKGPRNNELGYSFRGIDAVVNAVGPELRKHGVIVMPIVEESAWRDVRTSRDKPARECTVRVRYRFYGPGGDYLDAVVPGESMDFGDKGAAKAMSVAYRIALLQALCIPTDEPDPDAQTYERAHEPRRQQPTREQIVARAREAIAAAPDKEALDKLELRLMQREHEGAITAEDAIELRRAWVARLDEIAPAGEAQAAQQVVDLPVTQKQHKRMHVLWREVGLGGEEHRDARLTRTSLIVGRDIDSSAQLTALEADSVIDTLDAEVKAAKEVGG